MFNKTSSLGLFHSVDSKSREISYNLFSFSNESSLLSGTIQIGIIDTDSERVKKRISQLYRMLQAIEKRSSNILHIGEEYADKSQYQGEENYHCLSSADETEQIVFRVNLRQHEGLKLMWTKGARTRVHKILLRFNPQTASLKMRLNLYFGPHLSSLRIQLGLGTQDVEESLWLAKCFFCLGYLMGVFPSPRASCKIETRIHQNSEVKFWQCITLE